MESVKLNVPGITCDGWVITIRMAVGRLQGISNINGEAKSRTLTVEYEPSSVTVEGIQSALNQVGYESTLVVWFTPVGALLTHWLVAIVVLARSTLLAVVLWSLRFTGLLGTGPLEALLLTAMDTEEDEMDNSPDCHRPTGDSGAPWGG